MSKGGAVSNTAELQKEVDMLRKVIADKDVELEVLRQQFFSKEDAMNRLEAEVLAFLVAA
jgi:phage terminase large subunit-like protein